MNLLFSNKENLKDTLEESHVSEELSFQSEIYLSNQLNLLNHLKYIKNKLYFAYLNNDHEDISYYNKMEWSLSQENSTKLLFDQMNSVNANLSAITKVEITELLGFKQPPSHAILVSEPVCLLFALKPEWNNFKRLLRDFKLIERLKNFDKDNVSDYVLEKLATYADIPEFKPQFIKKISSISAVLCEWVLFVYSYNKLKSVVSWRI